MSELADRLIAAFTAGRGVADRRERLTLEREQQVAQIADAAERLKIAQAAQELLAKAQDRENAQAILQANLQNPPSAFVPKAGGSGEGAGVGATFEQAEPRTVNIGGMDLPLPFKEDIQAQQREAGGIAANIAGQKKGAELLAEADAQTQVDDAIRGLFKSAGTPLAAGVKTVPTSSVAVAEKLATERGATTRANIAASAAMARVNRPQTQILTDDKGFATQIIDKTTGGMIADLTGQGLKIKQTPAKLQEFQRDLTSSLTKAKDLGDMMKSEWVGPAAGRAFDAASKVPGVPLGSLFKDAEKRAEFVAQNAELKNAVVKFVTGAQMSLQEADRILKQVPVTEDKPEVWRAKYNRTVTNMETMQQVIDGTITKEDALDRISKISFNPPKPLGSKAGGKYKIISVE